MDPMNTLCQNFITNLEIQVHTQLADNPVTSRLAFLGLVPASFIAGAVDAIIGVGSKIAATTTLGLLKPINKFSVTHSSGNLLSRPYLNLLRAINPDAELTNYKEVILKRGPKRDEDFIGYTEKVQLFNEDQARVSDINRTGILAGYIVTPFTFILGKCLESENIFVRHGLSRLTVAALTVANIVGRVADLAIGAVSAVFSLLSGGLCETLNNWAYKGLEGTALIDELFLSAIMLINPFAFQSEQPVDYVYDYV